MLHLETWTEFVTWNRFDYLSSSVRNAVPLILSSRFCGCDTIDVLYTLHRILMLICGCGTPIQWAKLLRNRTYFATTCWNLKRLADYSIWRKITECPPLIILFVPHFGATFVLRRITYMFPLNIGANMCSMCQLLDDLYEWFISTVRTTYLRNAFMFYLYFCCLTNNITK